MRQAIVVGVLICELATCAQATAFAIEGIRHSIRAVRIDREAMLQDVRDSRGRTIWRWDDALVSATPARGARRLAVRGMEAEP